MSHQHQYQNRNRPQVVKTDTPPDSQNLNNGSQPSNPNLLKSVPNSFPSENPDANPSTLPPPDILGSGESVDSPALPPELDFDAPLTGKNAKRAAKLSGYYGLIGSVTARANLYDGVVIIKEAEARATEVVRIAMLHPQMMKVIDMLLDGNVYLSAIIGHGVMAYAILANHGYFGGGNPQMLAQFGLHPSQLIPPVAEPEPAPVKPKRTRASRAKHGASPVLQSA